ncbi:aspartate kinase [Hymenobacter sp. RP-2-7]|uniref:Aspartokinase n=1 Tax=Hymenobacter polaris TaxID=2682546 RepID=A0A7Y0AAS3_9BACT|nr:aspartate kinase [Hymenobacter polaris]
MRVYKFGGASVKDAAGILNVCRIVQETALGQPLLIVVSAMGKTTNALEEIFDLAWRGEDYAEPLKVLEDTHRSIASSLGLTTESTGWFYFDKLLLQLGQRLQKIKSSSEEYDEQYDQIISFGEMLASQLLTHTLGVQSCNCQQVIQTDTTWREGKVDWQKTQVNSYSWLAPLLKEGVVVTQGFLGGTSYGVPKTQNSTETVYRERTTTLGREGSDYSAAIFAYCLGAESVTIWKDVPGLLNADPRIFADTVLYSEISYQETIEMAYYGASVIHPKTLQPLAERGIPLYVKSFLDPRAPGTLIHDCRHPALAPAYIRKGGQCLLSFQSKDFAFISEENLAVIFGALAQARLKLNVMQNSAISFSVATDYHEARVQQLLALLQGQFTIHYNAGLTLFTIKHYDQASIERLTAGRPLLLEQRTRSTFQFLVRE